MILKLIILALLLKLLLIVFITKSNNVCNNVLDYLFADSSGNCYYSPDALMEAPELIAKYAGVVETHEAISEDGYILTLFRIPRKNPKGVIYLRHSLAIDSRSFVWDGNGSIAFQFWNAGYDVWLSNNRGSYFSSKHINLTTSDYKYWDFSFHEMGVYDIPAEINLIRQHTNGTKIIYLGHSIGTTSGIIYASLKPEEARESIKVFVFASTGVFFKYATTPIRYVSRFDSILKEFTRAFHIGYAIPFLPLINYFSNYVIRLLPFIIPLANVLISATNGWTPETTDARYLNFNGMINVKQFSWKTGYHFTQLMRVKTKFEMYDYGRKENLIHYHNETPPAYPIENFSAPVLLISSYNDSLTSVKDSDLLYKKLPKEVRLDHWKFCGYNHAQFYFFKNKTEILFDRLVSYLSKF